MISPAPVTMKETVEPPAIELWRDFVWDRLGFEFRGFKSADAHRDTGLVLRSFGVEFTVDIETLFLSEDAARQASIEAAHRALMERWCSEYEEQLIDAMGSRLLADYQNGDLEWDALNASLDAIEAVA